MNSSEKSTFDNFNRAWTHKGQVGKVPDDVKAELLGSQNNEITAMLVQAYLAGFELFLCKHLCFFRPRLQNCRSRELNNLVHLSRH